MLNMIERLLEMSKFRIFLAVWTSLSCAALVYMANASFKPELSAPQELISRLDVTRLNTDDIIRIRNRWPNILHDLHELKALFQALKINQSMFPTELRISSQNPFAFEVNIDFIELGTAYALSSGQIAHALLQNWYLQNASVRNNSERLQQILFADLFWAAAHSKFELGLPDSERELSLKKADFDASHLDDLLSHIASTQVVLNSQWVPPLTLRHPENSTARENLINPLSLRKYFLIQSLKYASNLSLNDRIENLRKMAYFNTTRRIAELDFLPVKDLVPFVNQCFSVFGVHKLLSAATLNLNVLISSDLAVLEPSFSYAIQNQDGILLRPSNIWLSKKDMASLSIHTLVLSVKSLTALEEIENIKFKVKKILAIKLPTREMLHLDPLNLFDFDKFARLNRKVQFAVFDQESLIFAKTKKQDQGLVRFLSSKPSQNLATTSDALGMADSYWDPSTQAFHAAGTIEALQIWRPSIQ